jgi:hypothetical protein
LPSVLFYFPLAVQVHFIGAAMANTFLGTIGGPPVGPLMRSSALLGTVNRPRVPKKQQAVTTAFERGKPVEVYMGSGAPTWRAHPTCAAYPDDQSWQRGHVVGIDGQHQQVMVQVGANTMTLPLCKVRVDCVSSNSPGHHDVEINEMPPMIKQITPGCNAIAMMNAQMEMDANYPDFAEMPPQPPQLAQSTFQAQPMGGLCALSAMRSFNAASGYPGSLGSGVVARPAGQEPPGSFSPSYGRPRAGSYNGSVGMFLPPAGQEPPGSLSTSPSYGRPRAFTSPLG